MFPVLNLRVGRRSGVTASFPPPSGRHRTTTLRSQTHLACWEKDQPRASRVLERARVLVPCSFYFSALCISNFLEGVVLLAQLRCELVQVLLRLLLTVEECFEEISLRVRQGFRPHGHGLELFLECSVFSRVFLMASLKIVSPTEVSWHFCS